MEKPETARIITARSSHEPCFQAATIPSGTPTNTLMSMAYRVRAIVTSARWPISLVTGRPEKMEVPRSPRNTWPSQMPTWVRKGLSRPELRSDARDVLGGRIVTRNDDGGIARREVQEAKDGEGHHRHHRDGGHRAAGGSPRASVR